MLDSGTVVLHYLLILFNVHNLHRSTHPLIITCITFFICRLSRIVLDLHDDTSSKDSSDSEDDIDEDSERPSLDPAPNEMPCSNEYVIYSGFDMMTTLKWH